MKNKRWRFTSFGPASGALVLWIRKEPRKYFDFDSAFLGKRILLAEKISEEEEDSTELIQWIRLQKGKISIVAEGFSAREAWKIAGEIPNSLSNIFLIFPEPFPFESYPFTLIEKIDWFFKNLDLLPSFILHPFRFESTLRNLDRSGLYEAQLSVPLGVLAPSGSDSITNQALTLSHLSTWTAVYRWETKNDKYLEPSSEKLAKILEVFWKSCGQKKSRRMD
ncbi:hypothetical protein CH373_16305 [Leptospira perolatii]|uniref:Uncharacterized protein n=1 Tax=Leptospira perolatii TaxID=2023191 RepID=A0A2M9ZJ23_9LEPT|nr:hypothetical protein [Leptospira perolatii]PJZ69507.1 hypothetical protein CH360_10905 [Leptospira perolatii]PJZ72022.1 hypothetical protein CH373_16305 [Leptospira perolatii]